MVEIEGQSRVELGRLGTVQPVKGDLVVEKPTPPQLRGSLSPSCLPICHPASLPACCTFQRPSVASEGSGTIACRPDRHMLNDLILVQLDTT